ncbi:MAG: ADP-ribosylglycohydrolase family protein, partial [Muribaculaceae bacterium]|nr:ADP-ribosylglycohydrolase family protein [Muribaculaceae bacterium]
MCVALSMAVMLAIGVVCVSCSGNYASGLPKKVTMSKSVLEDKIKGGWAGQTIGVSYGAPTEFRYREQMIPDSVEIPWGDPDYIKNWMHNFPGLYDDIYMDLTFVEVYDRLGINAPVDSLANAFAHAGYILWEANQTARYNILNGIMPPASGYWKNNPHADDIDFQIEADFAGLMSPGMPNTASTICDSVGHIMNYGDGWYGGVYMAAMYSLAFVSNDVEFVVKEGLKCVPAESRFSRCINDVISVYEGNPDDWKAAWQRVADKWDDENACPTGVFEPYNIDAVINSAYVVIGLLYGGGDFGKTIEIATRCGQDSDCNPASAGGILGTMLGYDKIPSEWIEPLKVSEDIKFAFTSSSLSDTYEMGFNQALEVIKQNGGKVTDDEVTIKCQEPKAVRLEQSFEGFMPLRRTNHYKMVGEEGFKAPVNGHAVIINGRVDVDNNSYNVDHLEVRIDGNWVELTKM